MKLIKNMVAVVALMLFLFAPAVAAKRNKATFTLTEPAKIGGVKLAPGDYTVEWQGEGSNVHLSIVKQGRVVTTTTGSVVGAKNPYGNAVLLDSAADGTKVVRQIDLPKESIVLQPAQSASRGR
jgi:hypothetical protein